MSHSCLGSPALGRPSARSSRPDKCPVRAASFTIFSKAVVVAARAMIPTRQLTQSSSLRRAGDWYPILLQPRRVHATRCDAFGVRSGCFGRRVPRERPDGEGEWDRQLGHAHRLQVAKRGGGVLRLLHRSSRGRAAEPVAARRQDGSVFRDAHAGGLLLRRARSSPIAPATRRRAVPPRRGAPTSASAGSQIQAPADGSPVALDVVADSSLNPVPVCGKVTVDAGTFLEAVGEPRQRHPG